MVLKSQLFSRYLWMKVFCKLKTVDVICDGHHLPFKGECFDVVRSSVVIEHTLNPFQFLKEQARVLKKGGLLYCEADNAAYWRFHIDFTPFEQYFVTHFKSSKYNASAEHHMIFYPESIVKLLKLCGLKDIKYRYKYSRKKLDCIIRFFFPKLTKKHEHTLYN